MRLVEAKRKQWYLIAVFLFFGNLYLACRITNVFGAALIVLAYSVVLPFDVFLNAGASKVLCRTMRVRKSKRQTESASMLCNQYFLPHVFAGGAVSAILLLTSDLLMTKVFHVNMCTSILQILALSIVFRCLFSWAAGGVERPSDRSTSCGQTGSDRSPDSSAGPFQNELRGEDQCLLCTGEFCPFAWRNRYRSVDASR